MPVTRARALKDNIKSIIIKNHQIANPVERNVHVREYLQTFPKTNLNGQTFDLTDSPPTIPFIPSKNTPICNTSKNALEVNMNIPRLPRFTPLASDNNMQEPSTSKGAIRKTTSTAISSRKSIPCYKQLLEINEQKLVPNFEDFNCPLCLTSIEKGNGVILKMCFHNFCRPCLVNVIQTQHDYAGTVKCPLPEMNCESIVDDREIRELLGADYDKFIMKINQNLQNVPDTEAESKQAKNENEKDNDNDNELIPALLEMDIIIPNLQSFECPICFVEIAIGEGIILRNCLHKLCKDCVVGCIQAAEDYNVKCPYIENDWACPHVIDEFEIRQMLTPPMFEMHLQKSLKAAANELTFYCRTPDCVGFVEVDVNEVSAFRCQVCKKVNCVKCKAIHEGKTCVEYQEDTNPELKDTRLNKENLESENAIKKMIEEKTAMLCPRCQIPVMKISGCDYIVCMACKLGICWCTKMPRQPFTKADGTVVEGCNCAPLKRCHPNCRNCH